MGIYSEDYNNEEDLGLDMDALVEAFLIDDLTHNYGEATIKEFCAPGGVADALLEAKVLSNKRTVMRLDKQSDLDRRKTIAAIQMAKSKNDPLYTKLVKYQALRKQIKQKIIDKYATKANKAALIGQRKYVKAMKGINLSNNINSASSFLTSDPDEAKRKGLKK